MVTTTGNNDAIGGDGSSETILDEDVEITHPFNGSWLGSINGTSI